MEFLFLRIAVIGFIATMFFSFLQVIVHFREGKLKFLKRYPFDRCQGEAGRAIRRKMI